MVTAESAERWMQGMLMFLSLIIATTAGAQVEMSFANKVLFTKIGDMDGVRLAVLLPAPVTNEYQERGIKGRFFDFLLSFLTLKNAGHRCP